MLTLKHLQDYFGHHQWNWQCLFSKLLSTKNDQNTTKFLQKTF